MAEQGDGRYEQKYAGQEESDEGFQNTEDNEQEQMGAAGGGDIVDFGIKRSDNSFNLNKCQHFPTFQEEVPGLQMKRDVFCHKHKSY